MRLLFRLALTLMSVLLILALLCLSLPRLIEVVVPSILTQQGFSNIEIDMGKVGIHSATVERMQMSNEVADIKLLRLHIEYQLTELMSGSVVSLHADQMIVNRKPGESSESTLPDPVLLLGLLTYPWDEYLPARSVIIDKIDLYDENGALGLNASVDILKQGKSLSGQIRLLDNKGLTHQLMLELSPERGIDVRLQSPGDDSESPLSVLLKPAAGENGLTGKVDIDLSKIDGFFTGGGRLSGQLQADISYLSHKGGSGNGFTVSAEMKDAEVANWQLKDAKINLLGSIVEKENGFRIEFSEPSEIMLKSLSQGTRRVEALSLNFPRALEIVDGSVQVGSKFGASLSLSNAVLDGVSIPSAQLNNVTFTTRQENSQSTACLFKMQLMMPVVELNKTRIGADQFQIDGTCPDNENAQWSINASTSKLTVEDNDFQVPLNDCSINIGHSADPRSAELKGVFTCQSSRQSGKVQLNFHFNPETSAGKASYSFSDILPDSNTPLFSSLMKGWKEPYDIVSGALAFSGEYRWWKSSKGADMEKMVVNLNVINAGGFYEGILFSGLDYKDTIEILPVIKTTNFAKLSVRDIDIGIPVEETSASIKYSDTLSGDLPIVTMNNLSLSLLGGKILGNDVDIDLNSDTHNLVLVVVGLDLAQIVALQQVDGLSATGRLDGYVPITVTTEGVKIIDGKIVSQPQGGQIKYIPAGGSAEIEKSAVGSEFVFRIIEDLDYDSLNIDVNYDESGEMMMMLALKGMSPKVDKKRPVHFNLNLEQNILKLLRGLRYAEGLSDDIDKNVQKYFRKQKNPVN